MASSFGVERREEREREELGVHRRSASIGQPPSIIASLRNVPWNLTVWPMCLRPLPGTIPPRTGVSSFLLTG
jgi:hypothetical protein